MLAESQLLLHCWQHLSTPRAVLPNADTSYVNGNAETRITWTNGTVNVELPAEAIGSV
jgi:hypothetical protein